MRSRSSRLFVVLLHLVGVSNNLPNHPFRRTVGIVGVHPLSILLEPLELQAAGGLSELLSLLEGAGYDVDKTLLSEPYWLQDDTDGTCLGPSGFSECGDATLWKIHRRPVIVPGKIIPSKNTAKTQMEVQDEPRVGRLLAFLYAGEEGHDDSVQSPTVDGHLDALEWEYALELFDVNTASRMDGNDNATHTQEHAECIISVPQKDNPSVGKLMMGSCQSNDAWSWRIDEGGVLTWERNRISIREEQRHEFGIAMLLGGALTRWLDILLDGKIEGSAASSTDPNGASSMCLWKTQQLAAVTSTSCDILHKASDENASLVSFSVIQYQNSAAVSPQLPRFPRHRDMNIGNDKEETSINARYDAHDGGDVVNASTSNLHSLPSLKRSRINNVVTHDSLTGVKKAGVRLDVGRQSTSTTSRKESTPLHAEFRREVVYPLGVGGYFEKKMLTNKSNAESTSRIKLLHHPPSSHASSSVHDDGPHRTRKIPVHPYIAASKDGYYLDEVTGLVYPTDISEYLGHDRKETGRHTLTGLGVYTRTMLKIKVYGVALYVSKRDVLSDPVFGKYAGMPVEELRKSDEFYSHLMTMGSSTPEGGHFDRTLFIKLNMQLATETVRQSLTAEWKLLTDEHKKMLSDSSAKVREADARMLRTIQSEENTSNCSCGQSAPPEYNADPSCCARGTEMVFTWRKNGDMELRIDGRIMDTFPYPEIGKGIFFEYLRGDDPMSLDARDHFADGFPFLLAPLAQFKDYVSRHESTTGTSEKSEKKIDKNTNKMFSDLFSNVSSHANDAMSWLQLNVSGGITNIHDAVSSLHSAAQSFGTNLQHMGSDIEKRREMLWSQILSSQRWLLSKVPFMHDHVVPMESHNLLTEDQGVGVENNQTRKNIFVPRIAQMLGESVKQRPLSDEIGVIIEPTMNFTHMMFLYLVHFYLLLLLIISVPDSSTTRLVVKRSSDSTLDSDTDHEERCKQFDRPSNEGLEYSCSDSIGPWNEVPKFIPRFVVEKNGIEENSVDALSSSEHDDLHDSKIRPMKKAFSYFV